MATAISIIGATGADPSHAAAPSAMRGGVTAEGVSVRFAPHAGGGAPLDRVGQGVFDKLAEFEQSRVEKRATAQRLGYGPATAFDRAKAEMTPGPAHVRPGVEAAAAPQDRGMNVEQATDAMMRSFDYAIETQLIVKTGSQFSTSLNSLLRGQ